jgi:hypothetical protein
MSDFIQMPKGFKNLLKMYLENEKESLFILPLSLTFGPMARFSLARSHFPLSLFSSLLGRPSRRLTAVAAPFLPSHSG